MKLNKFTKTAVVFTLGASVFVTTAFADMLLGSGYDKLKQAIKTNANNLNNVYENYTEISNIDVYLDDEILYNTYSSLSVDNTNKREFSVSQYTDFINAKGTRKSESYHDTWYSIYKSEEDGEYYGYKYTTENEFRPSNDYNEFFTSEYAPEIEKVIDAAVGNLKNLVQYDTQANNTKLYTGTLNASQVPALYNALLSLALKEGLDYEFENSKGITEFKDAFVSEISGEAVETEDGNLSKIEGRLVLSFNDQNSKQHNLSANLSLEWKDINNTVVTKPTVAEENINEVSNDYGYMILPEKYVGVYTAPIIKETDDSFIKIGERKVTITSVSSNKISGSYEEIFNSNAEGMTPISFEFGELKDGSYISYTNPTTGETNYVNIGPDAGGSIYFDYGIKYEKDYYNYDDVQYPEDVFYNSHFVRVFE